MPDLGKYAVEVLAAYGVSIGLLIAVSLWSLAQSRRVSAALTKAEARKETP